MQRKGKVYYKDKYAGEVWQDDEGYGFKYADEYLQQPGAAPVSLTLPLRNEPFLQATMLPFFDGLIPEGWLLEITVKNWKANPNDRMGLLLLACKDCLGAVSIQPEENENS